MPLPRQRRSGRKSGPAPLGGEQPAGAAEPGGHLVADQQDAVPAAGPPHGGHGPPGRRTRMPDAPWTSGSMTTAASSSAWASTAATALVGPAGVGVARGAHAPGTAADRRPWCRIRRRRARGRRRCRRGRRRRGRGTRCGRSTPRLTQYWKAILRACSTATAPSEAKRKWGPSTGTTAASASASSTTARLPLPSRVEWATLPSWSTSGGVELGDPVAEGGDPQRRDGVEVAAPVDVDELTALGPLDHDRARCRGRRPSG